MLRRANLRISCFWMFFWIGSSFGCSWNRPDFSFCNTDCITDYLMTITMITYVSLAETYTFLPELATQPQLVFAWGFWGHKIPSNFNIVNRLADNLLSDWQTTLRTPLLDGFSLKGTVPAPKRSSNLLKRLRKIFAMPVRPRSVTEIRYNIIFPP